MAANDEDAEVGSRTEPGHSFAGVDRVALVAEVQVVRMEPCFVRDVGLKDRYRNRKNCCECSRPGHGIADREASCKHTLADQADQVDARSFLSNRRRRQQIRDVDGAVCVSGGAGLVAAPPAGMARGELSLLSRARSVADFCVALVLLPGRGRRLVRSLANLATLVDTTGSQTAHPGVKNRSD